MKKDSWIHMSCSVYPVVIDPVLTPPAHMKAIEVYNKHQTNDFKQQHLNSVFFCID